MVILTQIVSAITKLNASWELFSIRLIKISRYTIIPGHFINKLSIFKTIFLRIDLSYLYNALIKVYCR